MKKCKICLCEFPRNANYFYKHPNKTDGLSPYCKGCAKEKAKKRNKSEYEHIKDHNKQKKYINRGVKPPFNYMGNKYFMYQELQHLFPSNVSDFFDIFCGSGMVGCNYECDSIYLNDLDINMVECIRAIQCNCQGFLNAVSDIVIKNKQDYEVLKTEFNNGHKSPELFYVLVQNSFNQTPIYGSHNNIINSYANKKAYLNENLKQRILDFGALIEDKNILYSNLDFFEIKNKIKKHDSFVFIDPPYYNTNASYNQIWTSNDEDRLLSFINILDSRGIKFGMTNTKNNSNIYEKCLGYRIVDLSKSKYKSENKNGVVAKEFYVCNY